MKEYCIQWKTYKRRIRSQSYWVNTLNYLSDHTKHRYELVNEPKKNEPKKQPSRIFIDKELVTKIIMNRKIEK